MTTSNGAYIDIQSKSTAFLPLDEACLLDIDNVEEAGIRPGLVEEFMIIDENPGDETLILSLQAIQQELAWERCRQLQAEDVIVTGKVSTNCTEASFFFNFLFSFLFYYFPLMVLKKFAVVADLLRTGLSIKYRVLFPLVCVKLEQIRFYTF